MSDIAIKVSNLSKCYQIYEQSHDRLKKSIYPRLQRLAGKPPRPQSCMPGRNRLSATMDRRRSTGKPGATANQEWLWTVPAARVQGKSILMKAAPLAIPDVMLIEPKAFGDDQGYFFESYNQQAFSELVGQRINFVQDNHSKPAKGILRGLHYQIKQPQRKLVRVVQGEVFDVAVDIRKGSPTFSQWTGARLPAENKQQLRIPEAFAHGFVTLSEAAELLYKTTGYYDGRCIAWNDSDIGIDMLIKDQPTHSEKNVEVFA